MKYRKEKDSIGYIKVPVDAYYGAQTQRSTENFKIGGQRMPIEVVKAFGVLKMAAARTNASLGALAKGKASLIEKVCPTAMHIAAYQMIVDVTIPGLKKLRNTLHAKAQEYMKVVKIGRTHFMDATPLTLGQELSGYASQIEHGIRAIENTLPHLSELALGGTAVGTGLNTPRGYAKQSEALTMAMAQVMGNDVAINIGGMNGHFELNVFKPMMIYNFLMSARLIGDACNSFNDNCAEGPNKSSNRSPLNIHRSISSVSIDRFTINQIKITTYT